MFNMYALWIIGPIVEALYGPARFLAIYLLCAAGRLGRQLRRLAVLLGRRQRRGLRPVRRPARGRPRPQAGAHAQRAQPDDADRHPHRRQPGHRLQHARHRQRRAYRGAAGWCLARVFVIVPQGARLASFWSRPRVTSAGGVGGPVVAAPSSSPGSSRRSGCYVSGASSPSWPSSSSLSAWGHSTGIPATSWAANQELPPKRSAMRYPSRRARRDSASPGGAPPDDTSGGVTWWASGRARARARRGRCRDLDRAARGSARRPRLRAG